MRRKRAFGGFLVVIKNLAGGLQQMQREGVLWFLGLELMQFFLKHRAGQGV